MQSLPGDSASGSTGAAKRVVPLFAPALVLESEGLSWPRVFWWPLSERPGAPQIGARPPSNYMKEKPPTLRGPEGAGGFEGMCFKARTNTGVLKKRAYQKYTAACGKPRRRGNASLA